MIRDGEYIHKPLRPKTFSTDYAIYQYVKKVFHYIGIDGWDERKKLMEGWIGREFQYTRDLNRREMHVVLQNVYELADKFDSSHSTFVNKNFTVY